MQVHWKKKAKEFLSEEKEVITMKMHCMVQKISLLNMVSDDAEVRKWIRRETFKTGNIESTVKDAEKDEKKVYEMYYEYEEPVKNCSSSDSCFKSWRKRRYSSC